MRVTVTRVESSHPDFVSLTDELTSYLAELNGDSDGFYRQFNHRESIPFAVVAYVDGVAHGCGALRPKDDRRIEIKRMFTVPHQRRAGVGATILDELLSWARELGYEEAVLETSPDLTQAVRLYQRNGFEQIPNFPPYESNAASLCLGRALA